MIRLFKHYVPYAVLLLGMLDFMLLLAAAEGGWLLRARQIGMEVDHIATRIAPLLSFGIAIQTAMIAVGVYGPESLHSIRHALARLLRSEEHTSELQSLMRISYAVFCLNT